MNNHILEKTLRRQERNGTLDRPFCVMCGEDIPYLLEDHHTYGRNNSAKTVWLCLNHHRKITESQNKLSPKDRSKNATQEGKDKMLFVSMGALLKEMGEQLLEYGFEGEL